MALRPPPEGYVRLVHAITGVEARSYVTIEAYRKHWYDLGWRSPDDPAFNGQDAPPILSASELARERRFNWYSDGDWSAWTEVPVSLIENTIALKGENGVGTVEATGGSGGSNDRRLFILKGVEASDFEVRTDLVLGKQTGIAMRYQRGAAVIVWTNIIFGADGNVLQGVWEFPTEPPYDLISTNQGPVSLLGFRTPVISATGDGATVTVRTARPHLLAAGEIIHFNQTVGSFGQVTVASVIDATTFTFANSTVGEWTGGNYTIVLRGGRRRLAARLVGNRVTWKQWLPGEPEPSWSDPDRAATALLPDTLQGSGLAPPAYGGVGIVAAHLGPGGWIGVSDFSVRVLG